MNPHASRYREVAIKTANPLQLVVLLYEGAIALLQEAQQHLRAGDISARVRCVNRAVAMISELQASLNFEQGGEIAASLDRLYTYMKAQIFKGNMNQSVEPLAEVVALLENLNSAWVQIASQSVKNPAGAPEALPDPTARAGAEGAPIAALNLSG